MKNMSKNTKMALWAIVIVIIVALIVRYGGKKTVEVTPTPEPVVSQTTPAPKSYKTKPVTVSEPVDVRSYAELIADYQNRTVQFGAACQVRMSEQVYKLGSEILIDNRNDMPLSVKIGPSTYDLGGYGHKVITLTTEGVFMIDCGANQNVATLTVQK